MDRWVPDLTIKQLDTSHWTLTQDPQGVNDIVRSWLEDHVPSGTKKKSTL